MSGPDTDDEILFAILGDYDAQGVPSLGIEPRRLDPRSQQVLDLIAKSPMRNGKIQFGDEGLSLFDHNRQGSLI